jgi:hypothetical protein
MAFYTPLEDGSYLIDDGERKIRTAMDPVAYGYELRSPEELAAIVPKPPTPEERLSEMTGRLDKMRRENDPEYKAFAEQQDAQAAAQKTQQFFQGEGEQLKAERDSRTVALGDEVPSGQGVADFTQPGVFANSRAPVAETAEEKPRNLQRSVPPQTQPQPVTTRTGPGADPVKQALSDFAARNIVKRTGPTKGGYVPVSTTTQREGLPSPEALANVEQAARGVDAAGEQAIADRAEALRAGVVEPALSRLDSDMRSLQADYERRRAVDREQARLKQVAEESERKAAEMPRLNARDDFWADRGSFAQAMGALMQGLFVFGQTIAGQSGPNQATAILESAIDSNAEKLREEYEQAVADGKTKRNAYSEHLAQFGDPESASRALRLEGQAIGDRMMELQLQRYGTVEQQAQWQVKKAERQEQRAREYADLSAKAAGSTVSTSRYQAPSAGGTSIDPKMVDLYLKLNQGQGAEDKATDLTRIRMEDERRVRLPASVAKQLGIPDGYAKDKEEATRAGDALRSTDLASNAIDNMERILERGGGTILAEDRADFQSQVGVLQSQLANPLALRQQTKEELESITGPLSGKDAMNLFTKLGATERGRVALKRARELFKRNEQLWLRELRNDVGREGQYLVPNVNE